MATDKFHADGGNSMWFRMVHLRIVLIIVLAAAVAFCNVAAAQIRGGGRGRDAPRPLDRMGEPRLAAPKPVEPESEPDEDVPEQNFKVLPVDLSLRKKTYNRVNGMLMAGKFAGQQQIFDDYYRKYFLARWTTPKNIARLHDFRKEMRISHLGKKSGARDVHDRLTKLVLEFMNQLVAGAYHPAVQINAMLMIGELNSEEQPPKPMPEALDVMLKAVGDTNFPDAVRAAAMVGIERHVAAGIANEDVRRSVAAAMLQVAAAHVPGGVSRAGREWIRTQAIEILAQLGSVGESNAAFNAMLNTLADAKLSLDARCAAAESLGHLNYAGAAGINPVDAAAAIGQFLSDACTVELRRAKETEKGVSRRRMKQRLSAALAALTGVEEEKSKGIMPLAKDPGQQAYLGELKKAVTAFIVLLDDKRHKEDDLEEPVDQLRGKLDAWLKKKPK